MSFCGWKTNEHTPVSALVFGFCLSPGRVFDIASVQHPTVKSIISCSGHTYRKYAQDCFPLSALPWARISDWAITAQSLINLCHFPAYHPLWQERSVKISGAGGTGIKNFHCHDDICTVWHACLTELHFLFITGIHQHSQGDLWEDSGGSVWYQQWGETGSLLCFSPLLQ